VTITVLDAIFVFIVLESADDASARVKVVVVVESRRIAEKSKLGRVLRNAKLGILIMYLMRRKEFGSWHRSLLT
jgi:hypothetical protein